MSIDTICHDDPIIAKLQNVMEHIGLDRSNMLPREFLKREHSGGNISTRARFQKYVYTSCILDGKQENIIRCNIGDDSCYGDPISSDEFLFNNDLNSETISNSSSSSDFEFH